jgi:hypothetical protein
VKSRGFAAVIALAGMFIAAVATPAAAADEPLITSTGLVDGQYLPVIHRLHPVVSDEAVRLEVLVDDVRRLDTEWPVPNLRVPFEATEHDKDVKLTVRAFDAAGAFGDASTRVRPDLVWPRPDVAPDDRTIVHGLTEITVTPDSDDLAEVVMSDGGGTVIQRLTEAPWVFHLDFTGRSGYLRFTATDKAGNVSSSFTRNYRVDDLGPVVSMRDGIYAQPGKQYLGVDVSDQSGVKRLEWWVDGKLRATDTSALFDLGTKIRTVPVEVRAWDVWDNYSTQKFGIRLDATRPVVTRVSPGHLALVRGTRVDVVLTATDPAGIKDAYYGGNGLGGDTERVRHGDSFVASSKLGRDGVEYIDWQVWDRAGNDTVYTRQFIVDNTPPKITSVSAPAGGAKVPATVKTSMAATDKNGIQRVELRVNGAVVLSDSKAPYNLNLNATKYGKSFTVAFFAIDRAGNVVSSSRRTWKR